MGVFNLEPGNMQIAKKLKEWVSASRRDLETDSEETVASFFVVFVPRRDDTQISAEGPVFVSSTWRAVSVPANSLIRTGDKITRASGQAFTITRIVQTALVQELDLEEVVT